MLVCSAPKLHVCRREARVKRAWPWRGSMQRQTNAWLSATHNQISLAHIANDDTKASCADPGCHLAADS